ncbi:hypothetical protein ABID99_004270 [Mucilaginibacter sp. OAE612]
MSGAKIRTLFVVRKSEVRKSVSKKSTIKSRAKLSDLSGLSDFRTPLPYPVKDPKPLDVFFIAGVGDTIVNTEN